MDFLLLFFFIIILFMLKNKTNGHYAGIMLDAATIALCPKLCRHDVPNASFEFRSGIFYATGSWYLGEWAKKMYLFIYFSLGIKETVLIWILELEVVKSQITI